MDATDIRLAEDHELTAVAELRWRWVAENKRPLVTTPEEFARWFVQWAQENKTSHRCMVAVRDDAVLGMAWLAIGPRVPSPSRLERASGDVQSVYVQPEYRATGLGGRLIDAVLTLAGDLGLERVTVHSSERAVSMYTRHGFAGSPLLLQAALANPHR